MLVVDTFASKNVGWLPVECIMGSSCRQSVPVTRCSLGVCNCACERGGHQDAFPILHASTYTTTPHSSGPLVITLMSMFDDSLIGEDLCCHRDSTHLSNQKVALELCLQIQFAVLPLPRAQFYKVLGQQDMKNSVFAVHQDFVVFPNE